MYFCSSMKKYHVEVSEMLSRIVEVEANNEIEATKMVRKMYKDDIIVLDYSDYKGTNICVKDEK